LDAASARTQATSVGAVTAVVYHCLADGQPSISHAQAVESSSTPSCASV